MNRKTELLAPAGSFDVMKACYAAGADAVYMGLNRYSARAFADNATGETYQEAIRYAHRRGKKLYLTVNTLFKEEELERDLEDLLRPLYEAGLDAVIVQDTGVIRRIRQLFPDLHVHASTQMTVTGPGAVRLLQSLGVVRVIPARELSLSELRRIKEETGIELECFIHGALCYSYSGQCLFSSMAGGRSGNRGRCAQPCRMCYTVLDEKGREAPGTGDGYVLSLKDLNTIRLLPSLVEAGIDSLKIEGRLKKAEYAAGVTAIYRKYLDLYEASGKEGYRVSEADEKALFDLFNRQGFTEGFYRKQNGRDMVTLLEPSFRTENKALTDRIRAQYIEKELQVPLRISYRAEEGKPLSVTAAFPCRNGMERVTVSSEEPLSHATGRPMEASQFEKQLKKLGGTDYYAGEIRGEVLGEVFIPVSALNELRRRLVLQVSERLDEAYERRDEEKPFVQSASEDLPLEQASAKAGPVFSVRVSDEAQLYAVLHTEGIREVILESTISEAEAYAEHTAPLLEKGIRVFLALPQIFRDRAYAYFETHLEEIRSAGFSGYLVRSLDGLAFIRSHALSGMLYGDHTLYGTNVPSRECLFSFGIDRLTLPLELNFGELLKLRPEKSALLVYGRAPMMVSANCIRKTVYGCDKTPRRLLLKDRLGNLMPVVNDCRYCMNTIFNCRPVSLLSEKEAVRRLAPDALRIDFTVETVEETEAVLNSFLSVYRDGMEAQEPVRPYTKGHFRRGVD